MIPRFDPAVIQVLRAFGRLSARTPGNPVDARGVLESLVAECEPSGVQLRADPQRLRQVLDQLRGAGLLEAAVDGGSKQPGRYTVTPLGWSRLAASD